MWLGYCLRLAWLPYIDVGLVYVWLGHCLLLGWLAYICLRSCVLVARLRCIQPGSCLFFDGVLFTFGLDGLHMVKVLFVFGLVVVHIQFKLI